MKTILFTFLVLFSQLAFSQLEVHEKPIKTEEHYNDKWCTQHDGQFKRKQVRLKDEFGYLYPDCVTSQFIIETEWASKHYEALGQAITYGRLDGNRQIAILLLVKKESDDRYVHRLKENIKSLGNLFNREPIRVFILKVN